MKVHPTDLVDSAFKKMKQKAAENTSRAYRDRIFLESLKKQHHAIDTNPKYWKGGANRRLVARLPVEVRNDIAKKYGADTFKDRRKFWEVLNRPENKIFLLDHE